MNATISIHVEGHEQPHADITSDHMPMAHLSLGRDLWAGRIVTQDPAYLHRLARAAEEAAVRLSAALDADAAIAMNQRIPA